MTPEPEFDYAEAARILRVSEDWLRRNTPGQFPHRRLGGRVLFSAHHLEEIREMHEVRPDSRAVPSMPRPRRRHPEQERLTARGGAA